MPNCRSCHAPVRFIPLQSGKRAIVDDKPVKATGTAQLVFADGVVGRVHPTRADAMTFGYRDHHATCPDAKEWTVRAKGKS